MYRRDWLGKRLSLPLTACLNGWLAGWLAGRVGVDKVAVSAGKTAAAAFGGLKKSALAIR